MQDIQLIVEIIKIKDNLYDYIDLNIPLLLFYSNG